MGLAVKLISERSYFGLLRKNPWNCVRVDLCTCSCMTLKAFSRKRRARELEYLFLAQSCAFCQGRWSDERLRIKTSAGFTSETTLPGGAENSQNHVRNSRLISPLQNGSPAWNRTPVYGEMAVSGGRICFSRGLAFPRPNGHLLTVGASSLPPSLRFSSRQRSTLCFVVVCPSRTMKLSALLGPVILAASSVSAGAHSVQADQVLPRDATEEVVTPEPEALSDLLETAKLTIMEELAETEAKIRKRGGTPGCTLSKLGLRRE